MKIKMKDLKLIIESYLFEQEEVEPEAEEDAEAEEAEEAEEPAEPDADPTVEMSNDMIETAESERDVAKAFAIFSATFKTLSKNKPDLEVLIPRNFSNIFPEKEFPNGKIKYSDVVNAEKDGSARVGINNINLG